MITLAIAKVMNDRHIFPRILYSLSVPSWARILRMHPESWGKCGADVCFTGKGRTWLISHSLGLGAIIGVCLFKCESLALQATTPNFGQNQLTKITSFFSITFEIRNFSF